MSEEICEHVKLDYSEEYQSELRVAVNEICEPWVKNDCGAVMYNSSILGIF